MWVLGKLGSQKHRQQAPLLLGLHHAKLRTATEDRVLGCCSAAGRDTPTVLAPHPSLAGNGRARVPSCSIN